MRVCLVSAAYRPFPSGVSEHVHHLGRELARQGHEVHVLTCNYPGQTADELAVTRLGRVLVLPANRSRFTLGFSPSLPAAVRDFFRRRSFDVVHCHGLFPPEIAYWAVRASGLPAVVTFHTLRRQAPGLVRAGFRAAFRSLLGRVKARIAVSQAGRSWAAAWVPGDYDVIPNGVDTARFRPDVPAVSEFADGRPTILYVGRLDRRKGLAVLLEALPAVAAAVPDVKLVVVGSGPLESGCRDRCRRLGIVGCVVFCGAVPPEALPGYYSGCTVYASPALGGEAMGIVLLEAMASGKAVAASRIPGYDEVITDGRDGVLVPPHRPEALARALTRLLDSADERERLAANALRRAQEFDWRAVAARVEQVYERVLPEDGQRRTCRG